MMRPVPDPILRVRVALMVLGALVVGVVAGVLGFYAEGGVANAVLIGGGAAGGALALINGLLGRR